MRVEIDLAALASAVLVVLALDLLFGASSTAQ
jgi:hypothetical protein